MCACNFIASGFVHQEPRGAAQKNCSNASRIAGSWVFAVRVSITSSGRATTQSECGPAFDLLRLLPCSRPSSGQSKVMQRKSGAVSFWLETDIKLHPPYLIPAVRLLRGAARVGFGKCACQCGLAAADARRQDRGIRTDGVRTSQREGVSGCTPLCHRAWRRTSCQRR